VIPATSSQASAAERRRLDIVDLLRRLDATRPARFATITLLVYIALSIFAYLPAWPGDPHRLVTCACGDPVEQAWYIGWVPWALVHGHNPFFTSWMEYPKGVNLAANTEMPLLGLLGAPITFTAGSVSSFSLLLWLAYPLSATAAFFALRHWTRSNVAAACGGLLYGFSAYVVGQGLGHLNLSFVPLPPLIFMALHEVLVRQGSKARRWGVTLGLLVTAQFLISFEVLATTGVIAFFGVVILAVARPRDIDRARLVHAWQALWPGVTIAVLVLAYPLYFQLAGPLSVHGPVQGGIIFDPFRADLLGPVVPTFSQRFAPAAATRLGNEFAGGDLAENGSYLGIPLLLLTAWSVLRYRRDRWVLLAAGLALIAYVLSLGAKLVIAHHQTSVPLPFDLIGRIPFVQDILPVRFSLYQTFFVAVVVALAIAHALGHDGLSSGARATSLEQPARGDGRHLPATIARSRPKIIAPLTAAVLIVAAVLSLVPRWPSPTVDLDSSIPPFFTSRASDQIPEGSIVLSYPFSLFPTIQAMLWQETDLWRWKLVGGYASVPGAHNTVTPWPPALSPIAVQRFLSYWTSAEGRLLVTTPPVASSRLVAEVRLYVRKYGIGTVIFEHVSPQSAIVFSVLERALGKPMFEGGVALWFDAQRRAASRSG